MLYYIVLLMIGGLCIFNIASIFGSYSNLLAKWPLALISAFILIIHCIVPILKNVQQFYRYEFDYAQNLKIEASIEIFAMMVFLSIFTRVTMLKRFSKSHLEDYDEPKKLIPTIAVIYTVGVFLAIRDLAIINSIGGIEVFQSDRIGAGSDRGAARIFSFIMVAGIALFARYFSAHLNIKNAFILIIMLVYPTYYFALLGSRNSIMIIYALTIFIVIVSSKIDMKLNASNLMLMFTAGLTIIGASSIIYSTTENRYASSESRYIQERRDNILLYGLDGAFGNDENLIWMQDRDFEKAYGKTYLATLALPIPRSLWDNKPVGGGPFLVNTIFPGKYSVGAASQSSLTTGMVTEAQLNFGIVGLFLIVFIWIWGISWAVKHAIKSKNIYTSTAYLVTIFYLSTTIVYAEFLGGTARVIVTILPLIIAGYFFKRYKKRRKKFRRSVSYKVS